MMAHIQYSRDPGTYPKKPARFFWVYPPKKPPKNPPELNATLFSVPLIMKYFIVFKAFKPMTSEFIFCNYSKIIGADI